MIYIEAIEKIDEDELFNKHSNKEWIFLAGSITGVWDWQQYCVSKLEELETKIKGTPFEREFVIFNPRRKSFDMSDVSQSKKQIEWEYHGLEIADYILFWFSHETLAPITLFEYGKWMNSNKKLFVGIDPKYKRLQDVVIQTSLGRPHQKINYSIDCIISEIHQSLIDLYVL